MAAFLFDLPWLVAIIGIFMLGGSILGVPGFIWVYRWVLRPLKIARPDILKDNKEPHLFAQGFGSVVLFISFALTMNGLLSAGWALTWVVIGLAGLNLFVGFCAGCAVYYWLNRLRLPGFTKSAPPDTFPGLRPRRNAR
jgi:hypothetical protein